MLAGLGLVWPKLTSPVLAISLPCNKSLIKVNAPVHKLPKLHFCIGHLGWAKGCLCVCGTWHAPFEEEASNMWCVFVCMLAIVFDVAVS